MRLKKYLLAGFIIFGALFSQASNADWVLYEAMTKSGMTTYYLPDSIREVDGYKTVMILKNFDETKIVKYDGGQYVYESVINRQVIDCKKNRYATASVDMYKEKFAKGSLESVVQKKLRWNPVKPGSIQEKLTEEVCKEVSV